MTAYRITERDARFIVGTEQEAVLICRSLDVAHQAVADAELLETLPANAYREALADLPEFVVERAY